MQGTRPTKGWELLKQKAGRPKKKGRAREEEGHKTETQVAEIKQQNLTKKRK